ncbi:Asp-tRNA(Asn)/Glu-tRNA(Gln) amidotransferase subunit GatB [Portibacter lacus]|uniref:Aspartyl/glutamyl-tRNA(Asn/Gln) amidotransferase subunit B n=1 Tax=Portibacter lacus TaxID=1099794 RepID=A0AA37SX78_9BACT|nr:Asp-tRNA(Asn)/Glu-tRNA(Gln) amidotransferase subunit GatB [Portibacter lacus]GLR19370.1 aspartyl/glutamyl-tRNA(Asn/Gln) amidotransferase subunit B [Portibacter lacus]
MISTNIEDYEVVVGLEVHVQLNTESKAFNRDYNQFGSDPNTNVSAITLAHPGTLPKANKKHIEKALILALATGSKINKKNQFDRKNYFYPDLPKGYQITQDRYPICEGGSITFETGGKMKTIRLHHIHMEEDAGKSAHDISDKYTMLDYNRAGTPLVEMVTEPDLRSAQEVHDFMGAVQSMVKYLGISDGNMEEGSMRCDCNVSIRLKGATEYGERCEIKNVNSKKFAKQAVTYEYKRQFKLVSKGISFSKQTLNFNPDTGVTTPLRSKEDAHDYRYFPDPDLPPLLITDEYIASVKKNMPMLPEAYRTLLVKDYGLSDYNAGVITKEKSYADYFLRLAKSESDYETLAKVVINKILPLVQNEESDIAEQVMADERVLEYVGLIRSGKVSPSAANQFLFPEILENPAEEMMEIAKRLNLIKSDDQGFVKVLIDELLAEHPAELEKFRNGNKALVGFFMGQAMKKAGGKADPKVLKTEIMKKLNG